MFCLVEFQISISSRHRDAHDIAPLADLRVGFAEDALVFPDGKVMGSAFVFMDFYLPIGIRVWVRF